MKRLALILILYLTITLAYGVINPLFEAPDEHWHFFTTVYIAENGRLPSLPPTLENYDTFLSQEAAQPPLYYLLGAPLIAAIDTSQAREQLWFNPYPWIGNASALSNVNRFVHGPWEAWPWQGYALAAHLLRAFSTLLGAGTLLCIYATGRLIWPNQETAALLATALVAFLPQFNFLHATVTNDTLIIFLASLTIYQCLALVQKRRLRRDKQDNRSSTSNRDRPPTPLLRMTDHGLRITLLSITIGLAALAKNAGILLALFGAGVIGLLWLHAAFTSRYDRWQTAVSDLSKTAVFYTLPILLILGWLWWRNWQLYGDPTATTVFIQIAGGDRGYTVWQVLTESGGLYKSFFAVFGWFNLLPPIWIHWLWSAIVTVALFGLLFRIPYSVFRISTFTIHNPQSTIHNSTLSKTGDKQHTSRQESPPNPYGSQITDYRLRISDHGLRPFPLLTIWLLLVYAGLVSFMLQTEAAQGRLLFPAIGTIALALAHGLMQWRWLPKWLPVSIALFTTLFSLFGVIRPAFSLPERLAERPSSALPLDAPLGDGLRLVGAEFGRQTAVPGSTVPITLYWQLDHTPAEPPESVFELFDTQFETSIAKNHSYHGRGLFPATLWPSAGVIAETFSVRLGEEIDTPVLAQGFASVAETEQGIPVGTIKIVPHEWPNPSPPAVQVADLAAFSTPAISLQQAKPGDTITIQLSWHILAATDRHYTTLIHLAEQNAPPLVTGDSPPRSGFYPTTAWAAGETFADEYSLTIPADLPSGRYPLWIGMYDTETVVNLPLFANGTEIGNGRFQIATIEVLP